VARPIHDRLTLAAQRLEDAGHPDSAADVRAVLVRGGWTLLRDAAPADGPGKSPLTITTNTDMRDALRAAADELGVLLTDVVEDGYRLVLEGRWLPPQRKTKRWLKGERRPGRAVMTVNIDADLRAQVQERLASLSEEAGYPITEGGIALLWMTEELGVDSPVGVEMLKLRVLKPLEQHLIAESGRQGVALQKVLEDGIRSLAGGEWLPPRPSKAAPGSRSLDDATWLPVRVNADLLEQLRDVEPRVSEALDYKMFPGSIAVAILKDRLGEPAA
jgi:hypothetical protein